MKYRFPSSACLLGIVIISMALLHAQQRETPAKHSPQASQEPIDATFRVLSIGVEPDDSKHGRSDPYALDAKHIATAIESAKPNYKNQNSLVLAGQDANKKAVIRALKDLVKTTREGDVTLIHFSTHGDFLDEDQEEFYFSLAIVKKEEDSLTGEEFNDIVKRMKGTVLVSLDTCCAAGIIPEKPFPNVSYLTASGKDESSYGDGPSTEIPHGYYIRAFLEALEGNADADSDGAVTFGELVDYLPAKATQLSEEQNAVTQIQEPHRSITLGFAKKARAETK